MYNATLGTLKNESFGLEVCDLSYGAAVVPASFFLTDFPETMLHLTDYGME